MRRLLALAVLSCALAGCGGAPSGGAPPPTDVRLVARLRQLRDLSEDIDEIDRLEDEADAVFRRTMADDHGMHDLLQVMRDEPRRLDRAVLQALVGNFGGGPVGLSTLAVAVGEESETVETVCEPFLLRSGFLARTPRGRIATAKAYGHLGLAVPGGGGQLTLTDAPDATPG